MHCSTQEKERLAELLQQSNKQMREFVIDRLPEKEAALQILQDAQKDLKKQFSRLKRKAADMQKKLEKLNQEKVRAAAQGSCGWRSGELWVAHRGAVGGAQGSCG